MRRRLLLPLLLLAVSPVLADAPTPPSTATVPFKLQVGGDIQESFSLTIPDLQKLAPAVTVDTVLKGHPYKVKGIPLSALLAKLKLKVDPKAKHPEAGFVVLARGRDGYIGSFAWPELMDEVGAKTAFLVWEANGKPLEEKDGPIRLVVPTDKKPMRWVFGLSALEVHDGQRIVASAK